MTTLCMEYEPSARGDNYWAFEFGQSVEAQILIGLPIGLMRYGDDNHDIMI